MIFKIDFLSITKKTIKNISLFSVIFLIVVCFFQFQLLAASGIENDQLIQRISKDYTNKFCNSIAFGLSKESAMKFANKENMMIFKNKKGFNSLNKELLVNQIANSVIETCGYAIDLKGYGAIE